MKKIVVVLCLGMLHLPTFANAAGKDETLAIYTTMYGRCLACGYDNDGNIGRRIGEWIDRTYSNEEKKSILIAFAEGLKHHYVMQKSGNGPEPCSKANCTTFPWP